MIVYKLDIIRKTLEEVCTKFILTQSLKIKSIRYIRTKQYYLIALNDDTQHIVTQELINNYIESLGDRGGIEIAGNLRHSIALEQSAFESSGPTIDEYWDGNIQDVIDYLDKKQDKDIDKNKL